MSEAENLELWRPEAAQRLLSVAENLAAAVRTHAQAVARATSSKDFDQVAAASDVLVPAAIAYADAQFDYTGYAFPFGVLHQFVDDPADPDPGEQEDSPDDQDQAQAGAITILQRQDYALSDQAVLIAEGRAAYRRVWPKDDQEQADNHVTDIGRALYQIAHAGGWDSLQDSGCLTPTGGAVIVLQHDEPVDAPDADEWKELFDLAAEPIYFQQDLYGD